MLYAGWSAIAIYFFLTLPLLALRKFCEVGGGEALLLAHVLLLPHVLCWCGWGFRGGSLYLLRGLCGEEGWLLISCARGSCPAASFLHTCRRENCCELWRGRIWWWPWRFGGVVVVMIVLFQGFESRYWGTRGFLQPCHVIAMPGSSYGQTRPTCLITIAALGAAVNPPQAVSLLHEGS